MESLGAPLPGATVAEVRRAVKLAGVLEKAAAMPEADARAQIVVALAHHKAREPEKAKPFCRSALDRCRRQKNDRVYHSGTPTLISLLAQLAAANGWRDVLNDAMEAYFDHYNGRVPHEPLAADPKRSPALLWAMELVGKWGELFDFYCRTGPPVFVGAQPLFEAVRRGIKPGDLERELIAWVDRKPEAAAYRLLGNFMGNVYGDRNVVARVLDHARRKLADPGLEFDFARVCVETGDVPQAIQAAGSGLRLAESDGRHGPEETMALYLARLHLLQRDRPAAAAVMRRLIERKHADRDAHVAQVCELAGLLEEARVRYERVRRQSYQPYLELGRVHEALMAACTDAEQAQKHAIESLRYYNGCLRFGSRIPSWPEEESLTLTLGVEGASASPQEARQKLVARLGEDFFLKPFLAGRFQPLPPETARRAAEHFKIMADERADASDRGRALTALRAIGPDVTPVIAGGLEHADPWVKSEIRRALLEWAEPLP